MGQRKVTTPNQQRQGAQAQGANTQIATRDERVRQVRQMLTMNKDEIVKALARQLDPDQFIRLCMTHYQHGDDRMTKADPRTFIAACVEAAQLGLKPDNVLGECYLLPVFSSKANGGRGGYVVDFRMGYRGLVKIVRRSGQVVEIAAEVVCANDEFHVTLGTDRQIVHVPWYSRGGQQEAGAIVAAYATAKMADGTVSFHVLPKAMLDRRAAMSGDPRTKDPSDVWKKWPEAMSRKAAATALCNWLPMPDDDARIIRRDEQREGGVIDVSSSTRIVDAGGTGTEPRTLDDLTALHQTHASNDGGERVEPDPDFVEHQHRPPDEEQSQLPPEEGEPAGEGS